MNGREARVGACPFAEFGSEATVNLGTSFPPAPSPAALVGRVNLGRGACPCGRGGAVSGGACRPALWARGFHQDCGRRPPRGRLQLCRRSWGGRLTSLPASLAARTEEGPGSRWEEGGWKKEKHGVGGCIDDLPARSCHPAILELALILKGWCSRS